MEKMQTVADLVGIDVNLGVGLDMPCIPKRKFDEIEGERFINRVEEYFMQNIKQE